MRAGAERWLWALPLALLALLAAGVLLDLPSVPVLAGAFAVGTLAVAAFYGRRRLVEPAEED